MNSKGDDAEKKSAGIGKGTPGPGRKPGTPNRATVEFRETVRKLLDENAENVSVWLNAVASGDLIEGGKREPDPAKALDLLAKLADYAAPRMGRVEHVGDGGGPVVSDVRMTVTEFQQIAQDVASKV